MATTTAPGVSEVSGLVEEDLNREFEMKMEDPQQQQQQQQPVAAKMTAAEQERVLSQKPTVRYDPSGSVPEKKSSSPSFGEQIWRFIRPSTRGRVYGAEGGGGKNSEFIAPYARAVEPESVAPTSARTMEEPVIMRLRDARAMRKVPETRRALEREGGGGGDRERRERASSEPRMISPSSRQRATEWELYQSPEEEFYRHVSRERGAPSSRAQEAVGQEYFADESRALDIPFIARYLPAATRSPLDSSRVPQPWNLTRERRYGQYKEGKQEAFFNTAPYLPARRQLGDVDYDTGRYWHDLAPEKSCRACEPAEWDSGRYLGVFGIDRLKSGEFFKSITS